jgi:hypothetical protein
MDGNTRLRLYNDARNLIAKQITIPVREHLMDIDIVYVNAKYKEMK